MGEKTKGGGDEPHIETGHACPKKRIGMCVGGGCACVYVCMCVCVYVRVCVWG